MNDGCLGSVAPIPGDVVEWNGYRITVLRADHQRVKLVSVRKV